MLNQFSHDLVLENYFVLSEILWNMPKMDSLNLYFFKGVFSSSFTKIKIFTPQEFSFTQKCFFRLLFTDDRCVATDRKKRVFRKRRRFVVLFLTFNRYRPSGYKNTHIRYLFL